MGVWEGKSVFLFMHALRVWQSPLRTRGEGKVNGARALLQPGASAPNDARLYSYVRRFP